MRSEEELMVAVQHGDRDAYQELYTHWPRRMLRFLMRRLGSHNAAEEAHQETWLRVYRYREPYTAGTGTVWVEGPAGREDIATADGGPLGALTVEVE